MSPDIDGIYCDSIVHFRRPFAVQDLKELLRRQREKKIAELSAARGKYLT